VEILTKLGGPGLAARNLHGSTPLHLAVGEHYHRIVQHLIGVVPPEELHKESGFGETPLELAVRLNYLEQNKDRYGSSPSSSLMALNEPLMDHIAEREPAEQRAAELRALISRLVEDKRVEENGQLVGEASALVKKLEERAASLTEKTEESEDCDAAMVVKVLREAVAARPGERVLVHFHDVLESVNGTLSSTAKEKKKDEDEENDDGDGIGRQRRRYGAPDKQGLLDNMFESEVALKEVTPSYYY